MYGGDCDAAIAKASAAVTLVQSQSPEVGSGDEGLGLLCFDLSSAETDFGGWRASRRNFAYFRVSCDILLRSPWKRSSPCVPTTVVVRKQPAKAFTLQGTHRRFIGDYAFHTSLRGAPLLGSEQQKWYHQILQNVQRSLMPHEFMYCIYCCIAVSTSLITVVFI